MATSPRSLLGFRKFQESSRSQAEVVLSKFECAQRNSPLLRCASCSRSTRGTAETCVISQFSRLLPTAHGFGTQRRIGIAQCLVALRVWVENQRGLAVCQPPNKQLQRTVQTVSRRAASASFHYALAARSIRQRAAAELRR